MCFHENKNFGKFILYENDVLKVKGSKEKHWRKIKWISFKIALCYIEKKKRSLLSETAIAMYQEQRQNRDDSYSHIRS